jgi:hypothetical protein
MAISTRRCADHLDSTDKHCPREFLRDKICRMYCERWFDALQSGQKNYQEEAKMAKLKWLRLGVAVLPLCDECLGGES